MPYTGFTGAEYRNQKTGANAYVRKHNPAVLHESVSLVPDRLAQIKNLTLFYEDLAANRLPQWIFITPNMTSDGHDVRKCLPNFPFPIPHTDKPTQTSVTVAGQWTRQFLDPLLTNKNFMNNTLVLVTFDENHTYATQNRIVGILLGDALPTSEIGTTDSNFYNHYSEIATVCANWDLPTLGRWDVGANVFKIVADKTGDKLRSWGGNVPLKNMFFNSSYPGKLNNKNSSVPWPVPNSELEYAGRKVWEGVKSVWGGVVKESPYNTDLEIPDGMHPDKEFKR